MPSFMEKIQVDGQDMELFASIPKGSGPFPAVIVCMEGGGVGSFIKGICDRLAADGFAAVSPNLYHRTPPGSLPEGDNPFKHLKDPEIIADMNATIDFLMKNKNIDKDHIGITGFCLGGRVSWMMAAASTPHIKACNPFYGGNLFVKWGNPEKSPFERTGEMKCPILFHFGGIDKNPSQEDMKKLDVELRRFGIPHEFYTYPGAGHSFMWKEEPRGAYNKAADEAAWPRTIEFFNTHLKKGAPAKKK